MSWGHRFSTEKWYDTVIRACALDGDIAELPQSDLTLVGSAGHSLSGGQKLRLVRLQYPRFQSSELIVPSRP